MGVRPPGVRRPPACGPSGRVGQRRRFAPPITSLRIGARFARVGIDALRPPSGPDDARTEEPLDAYSRVVISVAEQLSPSVANLRVMRRVPGRSVGRGRWQRRGDHARRLPPYVGARHGPERPGLGDVRRWTRAERGRGRRAIRSRIWRSCAPPDPTWNRPRWATPIACAWASWWLPSGARWDSAAPSPPAWSRPWAGAFPPPPAASPGWSRTSFRPTLPCTRATRAGRWRTPKAAWSGSTRPSSGPASDKVWGWPSPSIKRPGGSSPR